MIQTRDLQAFVQVMRLNSISLAASQLHITQSAVSRRLQGLENVVGHKLFEAYGRGIKPTQFAKMFSEKAHSTYAALVELEKGAGSESKGPVNIKVGATAQTIETSLALILSQLDQKKILPTIVEAGGGDILSLITSGVCDAGITSHPPVGSDVMWQHIGTLTLRAFAQSNKLGGGSQTLDISELASESILILDPSYQSRQLFDAACRLAGFSPKVVYEGRSTRAIIALAQAGFGIAVLPSNVTTKTNFLEICVRGNPLVLNQALVWRTDPSTDVAIDQIRELFDAMLSAPHANKKS